MLVRRILFAALSAAGALALAAGPCGGAETRKPPAYWPESPYPAGQKLKDGRLGCRMEMGELLAKYKKEELVIKNGIEDGKGHLGTYVVGDELPVKIVVGPRANKYFGSVKHGRDGGDLLIRAYWTDGSSAKVLNEGMKTITAGC